MTRIRGITLPRMGAQREIAAPEAPSNDFESAFTDSGSIVVECEFCGRTHFCNREDAGDFEPGELERLREAQRESPGKVMGWDCTSIGAVEIDGKRAAQCCPCRKIRRYEDWIWRHRTQIAEYLQARVQAELAEAKADAERLAIAAKFIDSDCRLVALLAEIRAAEDHLDGRDEGEDALNDKESP